MRHKLLGLEEGSSLNPASRSRRAASGPESPEVMSGARLTSASLHYLAASPVAVPCFQRRHAHAPIAQNRAQQADAYLTRVASSKFEVIRRYP